MTDSTLSTYWWVPFQWNWAQPERWQQEFQRSPRGVAHGLSGVRRVFDDEVFRRNWAGHQFAVDYVMRLSRWRILESGLTLADLPSLDDYRDRLLGVPQTYLAATAELRWALLLRCLGFGVQRDPANQPPARERRRGPDWLALHALGAFGVEVKCPGESDAQLGESRFLTEVTFRLTELLQVMPGLRGVDVKIDPAALGSLTDGRWVNSERIVDHLLEAAATLETKGQAKTALGMLRASDTTTIGGIPRAPLRDCARLRSELEDAAWQLRAVPHPGIIVVDGTIDSFMAHYCCAVAEMMTETWAKELALVVLAIPTHPGAVATFVPGPLFGEYQRARVRGPRACPKGHLHIDTFPTPACTVDSFDDLPPYCSPSGLRTS